ncbi:hypothetical protein AKO1_013925 [Acrasis kona]|uniref:Uncharacterized protein n=1 Tax=Acrasis kona TaxID=1008807 RepID=A0AAW2Z466_9EUKA
MQKQVKDVVTGKADSEDINFKSMQQQIMLYAPSKHRNRIERKFSTLQVIHSINNARRASVTPTARKSSIAIDFSKLREAARRDSIQLRSNSPQEYYSTHGSTHGSIPSSRQQTPATPQYQNLRLSSPTQYQSLRVNSPSPHPSPQSMRLNSPSSSSMRMNSPSSMMRMNSPSSSMRMNSPSSSMMRMNSPSSRSFSQQSMRRGSIVDHHPALDLVKPSTPVSLSPSRKLSIQDSNDKLNLQIEKSNQHHPQDDQEEDEESQEHFKNLQEHKEVYGKLLQDLLENQTHVITMIQEFTTKVQTMELNNVEDVEFDIEFEEIKNWVLSETKIESEQFNSLGTQCMVEMSQFDSNTLIQEDMQNYNSKLHEIIKALAHFEISNQVVKARKNARNCLNQLRKMFKKHYIHFNDLLEKTRQASSLLCETCNVIVDEHLDFILFSSSTVDDELWEKSKLALINICEVLSAKSVYIAKHLLMNAMVQFDGFFVRSTKLNRFYSINPIVKCYDCKLQSKRMRLLNRLQSDLEISLIFCQRLLNDLWRNENSLKNLKPIVDNDNGYSLFSQCFLFLENQLLDEQNDQVRDEREYVLKDIRESMLRKMEKETFLNLIDKVAEMLVESYKYKTVIEESHDHDAFVVKNVPQVM